MSELVTPVRSNKQLHKQRKKKDDVENDRYGDTDGLSGVSGGEGDYITVNIFFYLFFN